MIFLTSLGEKKKLNDFHNSLKTSTFISVDCTDIVTLSIP